MKILVLDDSKDVADMLAMLLELDGHEVTTVYGGRQAIEAARGCPYEVGIFDLSMSGIDGYAAAEAVKRHSPTTVLIALSGHAQTEHRRRATACGFDHHFAKPARPEAIERVLGALATRGGGQRLASGSCSEKTMHGGSDR